MSNVTQPASSIFYRGYIRVFLSLSATAGREVERCQAGRPGEESRAKQYWPRPNMAPHTDRRPRAWTSGRGGCCPSSTGTGSAYLACSVNLFKSGLLLDDSRANHHFKNTAARRPASTLTRFRSLVMRRGAGRRCVHTIRRTHPCADLPEEGSEHQTAPQQ